MKRPFLRFRHFSAGLGSLWVAAALWLLSAGVAHAHKVTVFAWVADGTVYTESKIGGGKRVNQGKIKVYDAADNLLLSGTTDAEGEFSFKLPAAPPIIVVLDAGMGHMARWTLRPEDVSDDDLPDVTVSEKALETTATVLPAMADEPVRDVSQCLEMDQMEQMVAGAVAAELDKKLMPVMRLLADANRKDPSIQDIMGGIGYIFGLVGIAAYFKRRKNPGAP